MLDALNNAQLGIHRRLSRLKQVPRKAISYVPKRVDPDGSPSPAIAHEDGVQHRAENVPSASAPDSIPPIL